MNKQYLDSQGEKSTMIYKFDVQFSFMIITHAKNINQLIKS